MLNKETVNKTVESLPETFTIDELLDRLILIEKIQEGLSQSEQNMTVSDEVAKAMISEWSK
ncbi:MAG: hypothetical protein HUU10_14480 [Bacteroidetes bacterium]|nr:hypothetical protein [Bacteroidota bacterium]